MGPRSRLGIRATLPFQSVPDPYKETFPWEVVCNFALGPTFRHPLLPCTFYNCLRTLNTKTPFKTPFAPTFDADHPAVIPLGILGRPCVRWSLCGPPRASSPPRGSTSPVAYGFFLPNLTAPQLPTSCPLCWCSNLCFLLSHSVFFLGVSAQQRCWRLSFLPFVVASLILCTPYNFFFLGPGPSSVFRRSRVKRASW